MTIFPLNIQDIQPSQFYVDQQKIQAISTFIQSEADIILPVLKLEGRCICLDGHTRLYYAAANGWKEVWAIEGVSDDYIFSFVNEAQKRGIYTVKDMELVEHDAFQEKWNKFCDDFFLKRC